MQPARTRVAARQPSLALGRRAGAGGRENRRVTPGDEPEGGAGASEDSVMSRPVPRGLCGAVEAGNDLHRQRLNGHLKQEEDTMDKDRIEGAAKQAKGSIKDAAGKVMGDTKMQAEGKADK